MYLEYSGKKKENQYVLCFYELFILVFTSGIGMLSKLAIIKSTTISIPYMSGPDTNQRIALHAIIGEEEETAVNVLTVHFSYDRQQQCNNAARIMNYISGQLKANTMCLIFGS